MDEQLRELTRLFLTQKEDISTFLNYLNALMRSQAPIALINEIAVDWMKEFGSMFDWQTKTALKEMLENYGLINGIFFKFKLKVTESTVYSSNFSTILETLISFLKHHNTFEINNLTDVTDKLDDVTINVGRFRSDNPSQVRRELIEAQNSLRLTDKKIEILRNQMESLSVNLGNDNYRIFIPTWVLDSIYAPRVTVTNKGHSRSNIWRAAESSISWNTNNQVIKLRQILFRELKNSLHINPTQFTTNFLMS